MRMTQHRLLVIQQMHTFPISTLTLWRCAKGFWIGLDVCILDREELNKNSADLEESGELLAGSWLK